MTTFTAIANAQVDQDSPVTQPLMQGLRDNVPATAEGATNAPVMVAGWHPFDMVNVGDGNDGKAYDFAVDGATTGLEIDMDAGFEYRVVFDSVEHGLGGGDSFLVDVFQANAASYVNLFTSTSTVPISTSVDGWFDMYHPRLTASRFAIMNNSIIDCNGIDTGLNYVSIGTAEYISKIRLRFTGDEAWSSGNVYVYRRQFFA